MKNKNQLLNVDFIGGQGSLTTSEEKALTEYFKKRKVVSIKKQSKASPKSKSKQLLSINLLATP